MKFKMGYLVEVSKKKGLFDKEPLEQSQFVLCSDTKLIELLQNKTKWTVWSANYLNVLEYQNNHEQKLELWGFDEL